MKISFIGHACFLIESDSGVRILLDPYEPYGFGGKIALRPFKEKVDIVVSTHEHLDHSYISPDFGNPVVIKKPMMAHGIFFKAISLPHDDKGGKIRGMVNGFRFEVDEMVVFHPGDIGSLLNSEQIEMIKPVDILFLPVGGTFTIGPQEGVEIMKNINPSITIPMHFGNPAVGFPLEPLDAFLKIVKYPVEHIKLQPLHLYREGLPKQPKVFVLDPTHLP